MIIYKTAEEIELLRESNLLVSKTHAEVAKWIAPGIQTKKLDKIAEEFIRDNKAEPGFLGYNGFPNTLCISVNDVVVHGIPSDYELKEGDIASIDCGALKNGFYGDSAYTYPIGEVEPRIIELLTITKQALYKAIEVAVVGKRLGDIGATIQKYVQKHGFAVVREMVGHGIGRNLHEEPKVPNYGKAGRGIKLRKGLSIAIEPMINMQKCNVYEAQDGWAIKTIDRKPSAHFEHTIVVNNGKADILSSFKYIEEVLANK